MTQPTPAATRYKEIVNLVNKASSDLRTWEKSRAKQLSHEIAAAISAVTAAKEREEAAVQVANRWWTMAEDNLERMPWIDAGESPIPAKSADPQALDTYLNNIRPAYNDLVKAVLALGWRGKR